MNVLRECIVCAAGGIGVMLGIAALAIVLGVTLRGRRLARHAEAATDGEGLAALDPRVVGDGAWPQVRR